MKTELLALVLLMVGFGGSPCNKEKEVKDKETCTLITTGTQTFMDKNLVVVTYRNGDVIPQVTDQTAWASLTTGAWCHYNNDPANDTIYGKLYNWYAVNDPRGLAPQGWHIPTSAEWQCFSISLGGEFVAGGKMKTTGTSRWNSPNTGATNESRFAGLPGGYRCGKNSCGGFGQIGDGGYWWSTSEKGSDFALRRQLHTSETSLFSNYEAKSSGFSVRCLRD
jgi:uncharacterized protein (TIGR02145 family)